MDITNKKILMALMSFSIGGAETHVLELSLELKRRGFDVVLISGGGEYEEIIKEAGIKHYYAPLYTKNPAKMLKAYKTLKQVIKNEKIDIVHAHGRIPAFLCGLLHKSMDFVFVTTAHWVFNTKYGLKYLSDWGEKVVAVSEDIKKYLMVNYNTSPMDIFVTINGIDTDKFSENADFSSVVSEFSLKPDTRKIVYISRMDEDRAEVAFRLLNISEKIYKKHDDIEIVVVGGGNVFDKLKEQADAINERLGHKLITLTGGRTDIYKFAALADIFIGVSRSALEAMSCSKPVIVAGNEGYIGIFDEDKLSSCVNTNFCCRGVEKSSDELLERDLLALLEYGETETERLGRYSRQTIIDRYSVSKMADDNIKMYLAAADGFCYDAVISGYYGFENSGDEALLYGIIQNLRSQRSDVRICVLSKSPKKTAEKYGVHSVYRYNIKKINKILKNTKLFISGGGSLLQDVTSSKSLWYYANLVEMAHKNGVKIMFYANGIGPISKPKNRELAAHVLNYADVITLREETSKEELKALGVENKHIIVSADPALSIEPASDTVLNEIFKKEGLSHNRNYIGISVREWKEAPADFTNVLSGAISAVCMKYGLIPVFVPLKIPDDIKISEDISKNIGMECKILKNVYDSKEILAITKQMKIMLAMRLHAVIYAAATAVPVASISYDPKVSSFISYIGIENCVDIKKLTTEKLINVMSDVLENESEIREKLEKNAAELKEKAIKDATIASEIIDSVKR